MSDIKGLVLVFHHAYRQASVVIIACDKNYWTSRAIGVRFVETS
jgi:hypothetical protein